jgi:hypothetical protein
MAKRGYGQPHRSNRDWLARAVTFQNGDDYLLHIEFRPNDLASLRISRLTDGAA